MSTRTEIDLFVSEAHDAHPYVDQLTPMPRHALYKELPGLFELFKLWMAQPRLSQYQASEHSIAKTVMVLPGFACSDLTTLFMRRQLRKAGYDVHGWGLGINRGNIEETLPTVIAKIEALVEKNGGPIVLLGWSLGGVMGREIARDRPELVKLVLTAGAPIIGGSKYTTVNHWFRLMGYDPEELETQLMARYMRPIETPVIAYYTRKDHIVNWHACIDPYTPNIQHVEVDCTHLGMGFSPQLFEYILMTLEEGVQPIVEGPKAVDLANKAILHLAASKRIPQIEPHPPKASF